jgi:DNA repair exonuclease SbcCD ATPase subunit
MLASALTLPILEQQVRGLTDKYQRESGQLELLQTQFKDKQSELQQAQEDIEVWKQVQVLLGKVSEFARRQLQKRIQDTVSAALQAVFEREDITFEIDMHSINNKPSADWKVVSQIGNTFVTGDPYDSRGGGISDVVSLALRLSLLELSRPKPEGPILLDEVGKHVSKEFAANVAQFIKQYAARTNRQIVLITHQEELANVADVSYKISQYEGISEAEKIG